VTRKDYSDATIALAREAARLLPETAKTRFILGSLLLARGRASEALEPLQWAASREPRNVYARMNLGETYLGLGRPAEAAREFQAVLAVDPGNAQAQARLKLLSGQGR
jgi:predicted Zn-dependent protease